MATINFLYRSKKPDAKLTVRLRFSNIGNNYDIMASTGVKVTKDYWDNIHNEKVTDIRDVKKRNEKIRVDRELTGIMDIVMQAFDKADPLEVNKDWLVSVLNPKHKDEKETSILPLDLVSYIDYYLEHKKNDISPMTARRARVTRNKLIRLQAYLGRTILVKDINEDFKKEFQDYSTKEKYGTNTQQREFKSIKTICYHARHMGLETHHQLQGLKLKTEDVGSIYLTFDELETITKLKLKQEYLENARDWLIVSCFTGQRVSDFMRFTKEMIRTEEGKQYLEFEQQKTGKLMTIPVLKEVRAILDKRKGNFPRALSDQNYNIFIKDVCELAGLNQMSEGKKRLNIAKKGEKKRFRDVLSEYPKWELVSSHIGRRSFATNYYGKVPTSHLINITGHGTEKMFLNYIKKSNKDMAKDAYDYFN